MIELKERAEIREFIKQQYAKLKKENTTANIATYDTPNAFTGDEKDDGTQAVDLEDGQYAYSIEAPKKRKNSVKLHELSYKDFKKNEEASTIQKINKNILEASRRIREVNQMLDHSVKLKTETKLTDDVHWKKTNEALQRMHKRLTSLSEKANQLYNINEANATQIKTKLVDLLTKARVDFDKNSIEHEMDGADHIEFDVMIDGEPYGFDYDKGQLVYMAYDKEVPLGSMDQEEVIIQNLIKTFK